ncbi:DUF2407 C-terminal domain-containing protein [Gongronella butleri]|nr:DUF2407 C-terminal domain-containing protein [Gongronella butleri]
MHDIRVRLRFSDAKELLLVVRPTQDSPASLKAMIRRDLPHTIDKNLRLIYNGQVLTNEQALLSDYGILYDTYLHCAVSDYVVHDTAKPVRSKVSCAGRGFDRLLANGFNHEEIRSIRAQFHRMHGQSYHDSEDPTEQQLQFEEQWMDQTGESVPQGTIQGAYKEMMCGLMLGLFLGVLCLFWVRESVFTRRHQLGIIAGMFLNISFGYSRVFQH